MLATIGSDSYHGTEQLRQSQERVDRGDTHKTSCSIRSAKTVVVMGGIRRFGTSYTSLTKLYARCVQIDLESRSFRRGKCAYGCEWLADVGGSTCAGISTVGARGSNS